MSFTPGGRRALVWAAQLLILAVVAWFAIATLSDQWGAFRIRAATVRPHWAGIAGSGLLVFATYALLVQSWRTLVQAWGDQLGFVDAARIWSISNLGRYVPGKLWSIGAMGLLAQRAGVSPVAAAGSAVVGLVVNLAAGFVVLCVAGTDVVRALVPGVGRAAVVLPALGLAGLVATPLLLPPLTRIAARLGKRDLPPVRVPARTLVIVVAANVASWIGYGVGFRWLARALVPTTAGDWFGYVAVFAGSYLAGYLALVVPGGLGVREAFMVAGLRALGLADAPTAALLAVASRLWLTVLELLPGLVFLARGTARPVSRPTPDAPV